MTPLAELLRDEIQRDGPVTFRRFMEAALYHPQLGYYTRGRDPFGKHGDYYTAEQLQPVFGIVIAERIRMLRRDLGDPPGFRVVELGAGRGEMASAFAEFDYVQVDAGRGHLPEAFRGVVFANEFFDALPVHVLRRRGGRFFEMLVGWKEPRFVWTVGGPAGGELAEYAGRYAPAVEEGGSVEVCLEALRWLERIAASLEDGYVFAIDYGYTIREMVRFPHGSLMSYRRHRADEDVLADPGERDITAHVNFTALAEHAARCGFEARPLETLARTLFDAGEADQFAAALRADTEPVAVQRRLQLKSLLYGMGENFRTLLLKRGGKK